MLLEVMVAGREELGASDEVVCALVEAAHDQA